MINKMDKYTIIKLKLKGKSFRQIARDTGIDRKTISKYWKDYQINMERLEGKIFNLVRSRLQKTNKLFENGSNSKLSCTIIDSPSTDLRRSVAPGAI